MYSDIITVFRICDRVIAGTYQLLVFVGISVLIALRHRLLSKNNTEDIIKYLEKVRPLTVIPLKV